MLPAIMLLVVAWLHCCTNNWPTKAKKIEVTLEAVGMHAVTTYLNLILYLQITDRVDTIHDMAARFPYKHLNIDKNGMRVYGGVVILGLQAYECADNLWVQLLE